MSLFFKLLNYINKSRPRPRGKIANWNLQNGKINYHTTNLAENYELITINDETIHIKRKTLNLLCKFWPIIRYSKRWKTLEEAILKISDMYPKLSRELIQNSSDFANLPLIERLKWLCNYGIGAHMLKEVKNYNLELKLDCNTIKNCLKIDLEYLSKFQVKKGYEEYGAVLYVNRKTLRPLFISIKNECYKILSENFRYAYNRFMASLLVHVTIVDHAVGAHYIWSCGVNNKVLKYILPSEKSKDKILLNFMRIFLFRTSEINTSAVSILTNPRGILSRIFSFTDKGLKDLLKYSFNIKGNLEKRNISDMSTWFYPGTAVYTDSINYTHIVYNFVEKFVDSLDIHQNEIKNIKCLLSLKTTDNILGELKSFLVKHIFIVSFWHEHVGNMSSYILDPRASHTKIYKKTSLNYETNNMMNVQDSIESSFLIVNTASIKMPKITENIPEAFFYDSKRKTIWKEFQLNLRNIENTKCPHLHPTKLETSVSL